MGEQSTVLTWADLLQIALTLTPAQLESPVAYESRREAGTIKRIDFYKEDMHTTDFGLEAVSDISPLDFVFSLLTYKAGTPFLQVDEPDPVEPETEPIKIEWQELPIGQMADGSKLITGTDAKGNKYVAHSNSSAELFSIKGSNLFEPMAINEVQHREFREKVATQIVTAIWENDGYRSAPYPDSLRNADLFEDIVTSIPLHPYVWPEKIDMNLINHILNGHLNDTYFMSPLCSAIKAFMISYDVD